MSQESESVETSTGQLIKFGDKLLDAAIKLNMSWAVSGFALFMCGIMLHYLIPHMNIPTEHINVLRIAATGSVVGALILFVIGTLKAMFARRI